MNLDRPTIADFTNAQHNHLSASGGGVLTSLVLDAILGSTVGSLAVRSNSGWGGLAPGQSGYILQSQGAGQLPIWTLNVAGSGSANIGRTSLTGNGTSTSFTLNNIPATGNAVNSTVVFEGGSIQNSSYYSVSGNLLIFNTAPLNGTQIEVITFS